MQDRLDPGKENRTFETRLEFISNVFSETFTKEEILASSIQFKLNKSLEQYIQDVNRSLEILLQNDPEKLIKKV